MFETWMLVAMEEAGFMTTSKEKLRSFSEEFGVGEAYDEDDEGEL